MLKRSRRAPPPPPARISIGRLKAHQCVGGPSVDPFHPKPFIGISDLAQTTYCEIQSTISQIKMQQRYVTAASMDDISGGVGTASHDAGGGAARTKLEREVEKLIADGNVDWETRCAIGRIMEQLELDGISTERRHFEFADFFVIGCPDGISGDNVVEFAVRNYPHLTIRGKRIQANLYAVLWGKPFGRVVVAGMQTSGRLEGSPRSRPGSRGAVTSACGRTSRRDSNSRTA